VRFGDRPILTPAELTIRSNEVERLNLRIAHLDEQIAEVELIGRRAAAALKSRSTTALDHEPSLGEAQPAVPKPIAQWTFETDPDDTISSMPGTLVGGAAIRNGRLRLDGKESFLRTAPLQKEVREDARSLGQTLTRTERRRWDRVGRQRRRASMRSCSPSDNPENGLPAVLLLRTQDLEAEEEKANPEEVIHLAVVYREDNSIAVYRNGKSYGKSYTPKGVCDSADLPTTESRVLINEPPALTMGISPVKSKKQTLQPSLK
jgi:hypothetical protein